MDAVLIVQCALGVPRISSQLGRYIRGLQWSRRIPASVRNGIEGAGVGTILQFPPGLLVDGNGAAPTAQIVAVAVTGVGGDKAIASELLIGVLLSVADGLIYDITVGLRWVVGENWNSGGQAQTAGEHKTEARESMHLHGQGEGRLAQYSR